MTPVKREFLQGTFEPGDHALCRWIIGLRWHSVNWHNRLGRARSCAQNLAGTIHDKSYQPGCAGAEVSKTKHPYRKEMADKDCGELQET